jgi:hypothetical protein
VTQYDPNTDPTRTRPGEPTYTETTSETVVVRDSNTGWWIAGILGGLVLLAVLWILFAQRGGPPSEDALLDARLDAAEAQAQADAALVQGQVAGAQASVDIAQADAARSQAEAARAASEARAAEARAAAPVIIEREVPAPDTPVVSPTSPQN